MTIIERAEKLIEARNNRSPVPAFNLSGDPFDLKEAYQIQKLLRESMGESSLMGYKMGLTSKAKQKDVGVSEPICGFLTHSMKEQRVVTTKGRIHPRAEPEIVFEVSKDLNANMSDEEIRDSISNTYLGIEILDSRYEDFKFKLADVIADNTSASGVIIGEVNYDGHWGDLSLVPIVFRKNGTIVATATPAAVLGHPFRALMELVRMLSERDEQVKAGMFVFTGGITQSVPFAKGDVISLASSWDEIEFVAD